jgi:glycine oxidase
MMVSVLGAGVAGLCCATALIERGAQVEVIDPAPEAGSASWLAGGMLAPFCEGEAAPAEVTIAGQRAHDWWAARVPGVVRQGTLVVAPPRDAAEIGRFARATQGHRPVDPGAIEPDLAGRFGSGLFFPDEAHLNPRLALQALKDRLLSLGAELFLGDSAAAPRGTVIDCRGMAAQEVLPDLRVVRGEMLLLRSIDIALSRPVRLLHPRFPCYVVPRGAGLYMVGATMVETDRAGPASARSVMELLSAAYALHPALAEAELVETGAGLRPAFADNLPRIRPVGDRFCVNGLYRHGFLMAPALAEDLARLVCPEPARPDAAGSMGPAHAH